ncbi:hypothetical protein M413DRAFT_445012 [Hebeloma cylindrosporum]|uniref:Alpha/beta hydrolase fold-3 domain-containing protein n=1 Tax=Hebeloma cylindrosporum TaxID=76867 RepID=A0A0C3CDV6_HEBCY|nr:hypothetical protein M413DRAFT_445012 [Hebeloma cylindrosporum h7]
MNAELPRNRLTVLDKLKMGFYLLPLPIIIGWELLKSPFTNYGRSKTWKRVAVDATTFGLVRLLNRRPMRAISPSTLAGYEAFMKQAKMDPVIEEIGEDARLLWILGQRRTGRVLLYFHGGAFLYSAISSAPAFWNLLQRKLDSRGIQTDIATLNYTLVPDAMFPVQLRQAVLSIQHLFTLGFKPGNIQLVGDSAGGALIHQVLSHILHPVEGVPKLALTSPFGGAYMMSPWTRLVDGEGSLLHANDGRGDVVTASIGKYWGSKVLDGMQPPAIPYLDAASAPADWLRGVDKCVRRVLISAGDLEFLRDEIVHYGKHVGEYLKDITIVVQENGIHDDPLLDLLVGEKDLGSLTPKILDWLEEGFVG